MAHHPLSLVESDQIGVNTRIWAFAHVMAGARLGANVNVGDHAYIEGGAVIGDNVTIKNQVCIWDGVTIEDDCFIGPRVTFTNDRHPRSPRMPEVANRYASPESWLCKTVVRRGCAIGAGAIICPGIILGAYSMIAAGAVVTRDVAPFALVIGSPAKHTADVCVCGQRLAGSFQQTTCTHCGEDCRQRQARLTTALSTDALSTET